MVGSTRREVSNTTVAYIAAGVVIVILMMILGISAFLSVVEISVEGTSLYSVEEVVDASGLSFGNNLMFLNTQTISQNIRAALPFVSSVQISRNLPGTVHIEVTESEARASIAFAGDILIIDSSGRVLMRSDHNPSGLIEIRGIELRDAIEGRSLMPEQGGETAVQHMQDILAAMERAGIEQDVSYLDVSNITNIHFGYLGMYRVVLGGARDLRHRLGILPNQVTEIQVMFSSIPGIIDMSDPSGDVKFHSGQY